MPAADWTSGKRTRHLLRHPSKCAFNRATMTAAISSRGFPYFAGQATVGTMRLPEDKTRLHSAYALEGKTRAWCFPGRPRSVARR